MKRWSAVVFGYVRGVFAGDTDNGGIYAVSRLFFFAVTGTSIKPGKNDVFTTPPPSLTSATPFLPMEQGTVKFSQDAAPNLGSLRPIVAQRTARYDVTNKCVGPIVIPSIKH